MADSAQGAVQATMDMAAVKAQDDLSTMLSDPNFRVAAMGVAHWIERWYLAAGYKRLCRLLIAEFGE